MKEKERATVLPFSNKQQNADSEALEVCDSQVRPWGAGWCSGAGVEVSPSGGQPDNPQGHTGRSDSAAWNALWRGDTASPQAKDPVGAIELHCPPI